MMNLMKSSPHQKLLTFSEPSTYVTCDVFFSHLCSDSETFLSAAATSLSTSTLSLFPNLQREKGTKRFWLIIQ